MNRCPVWANLPCHRAGSRPSPGLQAASRRCCTLRTPQELSFLRSFFSPAEAVGPVLPQHSKISSHVQPTPLRSYAVYTGSIPYNNNTEAIHGGHGLKIAMADPISILSPCGVAPGTLVMQPSCNTLNQGFNRRGRCHELKPLTGARNISAPSAPLRTDISPRASRRHVCLGRSRKYR